MLSLKRLAIAGGSLLLAAGAGVYMQTGTALPPAASPVQLALTTPLTLPDEVAAPAGFAADKVQLDAISLTSADLGAAMVTPSEFPDTPVMPEALIMAAASPDDVAPPPRADLTEPMAAQDCMIDLTGETRAAAMVALTLSAPCQPDARVAIDHGALHFTIATDADGKAEVLVPALSENALFVATMDDGNAAAVEMVVDTLSFYDRAVVQSDNGNGITLHAREFGAAYDSDGHVWAGHPRDASVAARGQGGFVTRLGDAAIPGAKIADVYTFPTSTATVVGDIALTIEVEVTTMNCGRQISAQVIEVSQATAPGVSALDVSLPDCDAVGDYLLLKNLIDDLKIAAR